MDNEWRKLTIIHAYINIQGQNEPLDFIVRKTHRGVLIWPELILGAEGTFFGSSLPKTKISHFYSLGWGGAVNPGEDFIEF